MRPNVLSYGKNAIEDIVKMSSSMPETNTKDQYMRLRPIMKFYKTAEEAVLESKVFMEEGHGLPFSYFA